MTSDVKSLQQERIQIYHDLMDNKIPKRVPVTASLSLQPLAEWAGIDLHAAHWKPSLLAEAADKLCQVLYSDTLPAGGSLRYPSFYEVLESQSFVMSSSGFIQHPETVGMEVEDYDYLIEKPYDCLLERVIPRQYKALNLDDPVSMALALTKSYMGYYGDNQELAPIFSELIEKYGYYPGPPPGSTGFTATPFDFLADQLRGFRNISMDIRRIPEKVLEACEALYPIVLKRGMPANPSNYGFVSMPLHMPTYMREKDFEKLYWPTFKRQLDEYASHGVHASIFCEDNWMRYLDYLYELPTDTIIMFEYGDPKLIKEKLGKKHIIVGMFPVVMLRTHTKEECVDYCKRMLDILAPGGKYRFALDKNPVSINDINLENYIAVTETVRDYGVYDNAGEVAGEQFNKEDYKVEPSRPFESRYFTTWEKFKAKHPHVSEHGKDKLQEIEERLFQYLMWLLM
ncbi:MAG: uroporphyrinogen decarboxylase [Firmicutes bacterium]|nr:uroporphyrinogen decarboxylase [Bacillota bacterium]